MIDVEVQHLPEQARFQAVVDGETAFLTYERTDGRVAMTHTIVPPEIGRRGIARVFDETVFDRLALITVGRSAGFTLDEIALMFAPDGRPRLDRTMLAGKADDLDATITRLTAMRDGLRHAAACPAASHMECPTFRRILREAGATG